MTRKTYEFRGVEYSMEAETTALLIIDLQNDYMWESYYPGKPRGDGVGLKNTKESREHDTDFMRATIPVIKKLSEEMRGMGVTVIHCIVTFEPDHADDGTPPRAPEKWHHLVKGTWGAQILDEFTPKKGDYVVEAKCQSKFPYTPLEIILRNKGIKTLVFAGFNASVCVEATIRDAVTKGFHCIMTSEGTGSHSRQLQEDTLKRLHQNNATVMTCDEVVALLRDSRD